MKLGILGGTFDPIHLGHLAAADAAAAVLGLDQVMVVPSHRPPHRQTEPRASAFHRFAMVALALADRPRLVASDVELLAASRSYTSVTLRRLHESSFDALQLFFITGADAFEEIETWKDYPAILELAHFVVVSRPGHPVGGLLDLLPALGSRMTMVSGVEDARATCADARGTRIWLVDARTPEVSSTSIRRRAAAGEPLEGFVPAAVEDYIHRHSLYSALEETQTDSSARPGRNVNAR